MNYHFLFLLERRVKITKKLQHFEFVGEPLGEDKSLDPTFVKLELVHEPLGEMAPAALGKDGALGTELHASLKTFLE